MKVSAILSITAAVIGLTSAGLTANYDDLAAKGYRWVTIDGPYGCPAKDDLQQIVKKPTDETELQQPPATSLQSSLILHRKTDIGINLIAVFCAATAGYLTTYGQDSRN